MRLVVVFMLGLLVGCGAGISDSVRADRQPGATLGAWGSAPTVLLHPSLTEAQEKVVRQEVAALNTLSGKTYNVRPMSVDEKRRHLVYGGVYGRVVVMNAPPMIYNGEATCEIYYSSPGVIKFVEVRLKENNSARIVRHELVHALTGAGDIVGGDPELLMSISDTGHHHDDGATHRLSSKDYSNGGTRLLPSELSRFP